MELTKGFYIIDSLGNIRCKTVRTKSQGEVQVPIRLRTIAAAKDFSACIDESAVLCVSTESFHWGE